MASSQILLKLTEEKIAKYKEDIKNKEEMSQKITDILTQEYEERFSEILTLSKDQFFQNITKGVFSTLEDIYTNIIKEDEKLETLIDENMKNFKNQYDYNYNILKNEWENYNKDKNGYNYVNRYRKHCFDDNDYACHSCDKDSKFVLISSNNNDNFDYVICSNCQKVYKSSLFLCKCFHCDEEYYSQLLSNEVNLELFLATWKKYHCPQLINNKMICIKCKSPIYLNMKTGLLNCINKECNFVSKPRRISWICSNCKKDFSSGAKVYNPLELDIIQKVIKKTLLLKHRAYPNFMPCCKLNVHFTEFYHKKNCQGILYLGKNKNNELIIVCQKCRAINYYDKFIWTCPKCQNKFRVLYDKNDNNKNEKSNNENKNIINKKEKENNHIYNNYKSRHKLNYNKFKIKEIIMDNKDKNGNERKIENQNIIEKAKKDDNKNENEEKENNENNENKKFYKFNYLQKKKEKKIKNDKKQNDDNDIKELIRKNSLKQLIDTPTKKKNNSKSNVFHKVKKYQSFRYRRQYRLNTDKAKPVNFLSNDNNLIQRFKIQNNFGNAKSTLTCNINDSNQNKDSILVNDNNSNIIENKTLGPLKFEENKVETNGTSMEKKPKYFQRFMKLKKDEKILIDKRRSAMMNFREFRKKKNLEKDNNKIKQEEKNEEQEEKNIKQEEKNVEQEEKNVKKEEKNVKQEEKNSNKDGKKINITTLGEKKDKDNDKKEINGNEKDNLAKKSAHFKRFLFLRRPKISLFDSSKNNNQDKNNCRGLSLKNLNTNSKMMERMNGNKNTPTLSSSSSFSEKMDKLNNAKISKEKSKISTKVDSIDGNKKEKRDYQEENEVEEFEVVKDKEEKDNNKKNEKEEKEESNEKSEKEEEDKGEEDNERKEDSDQDSDPSDSKKSKIQGVSDHHFSQLTKKINHILENCKINQFNIEDYKVNRKLGEGSYGIIHCVTNEKTQEKFALKKIVAYSLKKIAELIKEFELVHLCNHPNILKIYGLNINLLDHTTYSLKVLMEKAERDWDRDIRRRSHEKNYYTEEELISIMRQITSALLYMQEKLNISHRDIKPQNVLIFEGGIYKLADFGEAKEIKLSKNMNTLRGTELYMSPALYNGLKANKDDIIHDTYKSDLFSLGFCLIYAATMNFDFLYELRIADNTNEIRKKINERLKSQFSEKFINVISKMVELDENKRYNFKELYEEISKNFGN